jgi:hypothetical protein
MEVAEGGGICRRRAFLAFGVVLLPFLIRGNGVVHESNYIILFWTQMQLNLLNVVLKLKQQKEGRIWSTN